MSTTLAHHSAKVLEAMKRMHPYVPYGPIALTAVYMIICLFVRYLVPPCEHVDDGFDEACGYEGMDNSTVAFSTDFFITIFVAALALHLYLRTTRKILTTLVFATFSFGYLFKGLAVRFFGNNGLDDGNGMKGFFFLTLIQYLSWTSSTLFIGFLVHHVWTLIDESARFCGSIESKIAIFFNVLSGLVVAMGCFWNGIARWNLSEDVVDADEAEEPAEKQSNMSLQLLRVGQLAWQGSYCMVLIATAYVLGALAKQKPRKIFGLSNYTAAAGIVMAQVALAAFVIYYALPDGSGTSKGWATSEGSSVPSTFINYFMLMTAYLLHNLVLTLFGSKSMQKKVEKVNDVEGDTDELDSSEDGSLRDIEDGFFDSERLPDDDVTSKVAPEDDAKTNWLFFFLPMLKNETYTKMDEETEEIETHQGIKGPGGAKITICEETSIYDVEEQNNVDYASCLQFSPDQLQVAIESSEEEESSAGADLWNGARQCVETPFDQHQISRGVSKSMSGESFVESHKEEVDGVKAADAPDKNDDNSNRSAVRKIFAALGLTQSRSKHDAIETYDSNSMHDAEQHLTPSYTGVEISPELCPSEATSETHESTDIREEPRVLSAPSERSAETVRDDISNSLDERSGCEQNIKGCEFEQQTTILRIDELEPELVQPSEIERSQSREKQQASITTSFTRRQKEKDSEQDSQFSAIESKSHFIAGTPCILGNSSPQRDSEHTVENTIESDIAINKEEDLSGAADREFEMTIEEAEEAIEKYSLQQKSNGEVAANDSLTKTKSGSRHRRGFSLSSKFSSLRRRAESSGEKREISRQVRATEQHDADSLHQDCSSQQTQEADASNTVSDDISALSSVGTETDDDGSESSESDESSATNLEPEEPESFRASLLHVINPFKKEDEEILFDNSSSDSDESSTGMDSEVVASFDDSVYSAEVDDGLEDESQRDPFEVYNSFSEETARSEDSIEHQDFQDKFPLPDFKGVKQSWSSIERKPSSIRNTHSAATAATVNRSNVTAELRPYATFD